MELTKEYFDKHLKNLATKDDLKRLSTKADLANEREHSDTKFDAMFEGFKSANDNLNGVATDVKSIKEELKTLNKRDLEDSNAFAKDILKLEKRILRIEKQLKIKVA